MATQTEINAFGDLLSSYITTADATAPAIPETDDIAVIEAFAVDTLRPHQMRKGLATAIAIALDPAWQPVEPKTSSNPEAAKFGTGWLSKGAGWAEAEYRRTPLLSTVELRGYIYTSAASNTLILTLPPSLRPAQNELFATVIDYQPAYINVWVDGTVSVYFAEATTRQMVTLSGISWEGAV